MNMKKEKTFTNNSSFLSEAIKKDPSSKKIEKKKNMINSITSRNKNRLLQIREVSSLNNTKFESKNNKSSKYIVTENSEKYYTNLNPILELVYIHNEISYSKESYNYNHLKYSFFDLNKIFIRNFENKDDDSMSKNNSESISINNLSVEKKRIELNKKRDEKKLIHVLLIQRIWRNYKLRKSLNIKENYMFLNKNEIIRLCRKSLIEDLLKFQNFKEIINLINQTISLWNDFLKIPTINLTKSNIINYKNENLHQHESFSHTISKFITNILKLKKSINEQNNDLIINNMEKNASISKSIKL